MASRESTSSWNPEAGTPGTDAAREDDDLVVYEATRTQMQHFQQSDPRCRALQLPEGLLLRYTLSRSLYFYLHTIVMEGKITTRIFASDSPYERKKTEIGAVATPMFEPQADGKHLQRLEKVLRAWVDFVREGQEGENAFTSFPVQEQHD